ncbi:hypothetical protein A2Z22_02895 [Candidatus Woesebacteria bacterium RBG_16_34_12]|uniref:PrgI family protein n=1 Tax=Candidatus Woesebacteria bacterium RBG_16_34_12 TaxID=1802480 RepID=A0A1F7X8V8_9BACT|nr:MAG: hypothetical protein A2Z22_02895 [Candidatus Woesebacteria bacterium RBG_16_34_12]
MPEIFEEQHPIPQQISAYQFKLVGDMTLKQFMQVAGGALISLLIYSSPLHPAIKWPLILISFLMGIALAFFPVEDRPLAKWIIIFFRSIYSPTIFIWKKTAQPTAYFQPEETQVPIPVEKEVIEPALIYTATPQALAETPQDEQKAAMVKLEHKEQNFLSKVTSLFILPSFMLKPTVPTTSPTAQTTPPSSAKPGVKIPEPITITVEPSQEKKGKKEKWSLSQDVSREELESVIAPVIPSSDSQSALTQQQVKFSADAAPPIPPTIANVVVGQVVDPEGKIIDGAILEIRDEAGRPIRALKSNKLGHFMIVTPLMEGKYEIITEKEGFIFEPVSFNTVGEIIPPIAIWAKEKAKS